MTSKPNGRPIRFPLGQRLRAKCLFLAGKSYREISEETAVPKEWLRQHAQHQGWCALRLSPEARAAALATTNAALAEWNASISAETQSLSMEAIPLVRSALDRGSARDAKDSTAALKTLVEIARETSGIGEKDTAAKSAPSIGLFFFNEPVQRARPELDVTPTVTIEKPALAEVEFE